MTDEQIAEQLRAAYLSGQLAERQRLAEATAELDAIWRPACRRTHEERVAERIAAMELAAFNNPAARWRGLYPGGPVDYETGLLSGVTR